MPVSRAARRRHGPGPFSLCMSRRVPEADHVWFLAHCQPPASGSWRQPANWQPQASRDQCTRAAVGVPAVLPGNASSGGVDAAPAPWLMFMEAGAETRSLQAAPESGECDSSDSAETKPSGSISTANPPVLHWLQSDSVRSRSWHRSACWHPLPAGPRRRRRLIWRAFRGPIPRDRFHLAACQYGRSVLFRRAASDIGVIRKGAIVSFPNQDSRHLVMDCFRERPGRIDPAIGLNIRSQARTMNRRSPHVAARDKAKKQRYGRIIL